MANLTELLNKAREQNSFWESSLQADIASQVLRLLQQNNMSQARLAEALQVNPAYVSRVLGGGENLSIKTMVKIARALNKHVKIDFVDSTAKAVKAVPSDFTWADAMKSIRVADKPLAFRPFQCGEAGWESTASNDVFAFHHDERVALVG
ncbi:helix-turn-helix domain-containing protein [Achromobacter animicus]|uniref:helix-turn-helix domain-containing protein n=1 Tax=Achromobacter animicus TaxID=1389935 RepID=UPI00146514C5|nr:helix-turn-helix transcriptional regulator [Achromobacter animicus]CAB3850998.1 hypothetical protein LMG26691_01983 [Achromobacter animicus]